MHIKFTTEDIPYNVAYNAYRGSSFSPDKRAENERASYYDYIESVVQRFEKYDNDSNQNRASLESDLQAFVNGYLKRKLEILRMESGHVSTMIAGPANFPARRMNKLSDRIGRKCQELVDYCDNTLRKLEAKHNPRAWDSRPIQSGACDAVERLREKLAKAETLQDTMKKANRIARSKKLSDDEKVAKLAELDGISEDVARELLVTEYSYQKPGFQPYKLQNNGATIRRLKERLERVIALQQSPAVEVEHDDYTIEEDANDNRIRVTFVEKPSRTVCDWMGSRGWKYSPRNTAWQRAITANARKAARVFVQAYEVGI